MGSRTFLSVTDSDHTSLDQRYILVKIKDMLKKNCYKLQCEFGTLQQKVITMSLNTVPEAII